MKNVNYKRLLLMSLLAHYSDEGQCWAGGWDRETHGIDGLTQDEKKALQEVLDEVGKLVGEEISCEGFSKERLHCELCGVKVEYLDDLNEYDDMFNNSYQCCDSCAEKLEQGIRNIAFAIRDKAFRNKNRQHK